MNHPRIFVQIASYRDPECQWTIKDLFARAKYPDRVFVGVCAQFGPEDDADCFEVVTRPDQVRVVEFHADESRGLGWARHQAWTLWQDEEFILQIDSHMRFVDDWDARMIDMLGQCDSPQAILSAYPPGYEPPDILLSEDVTKHFCREFLDNGVVTLGAGGTKELEAATAPSPSAFVAGGFLFAPSRAITQVPHDPHVFFWGEEISRAVRLWTSGWDLFAPHEVLIYHYYGMRDKNRRRNVGHPDAGKLEKLTTERVKHYLGIAETENPAALVDIEKYGLGRERPLADYEAFSGLNFGARTIARYAKIWPFYLTEEAANARDDLRLNPALAESAQAYVVEDSGVVFYEPAQEIYHLNRAAMFIWCSLEDDQPQADIVRLLAASLGVSEDRADEVLTETLQHWWDIGLLASSPQMGPSETLALRNHLNLRPWADTDDYPEAPAADRAQQRFYRLMNATVRVCYETAAQEAIIHPIVAHLETGAPPADFDSTVSVVQHKQEYFVYQDDEPRNRCLDISGLGPIIKSLILQAGVNSQDYFMCIHAGVVTDGRTCILIPGESGRGKSSLTAALVKAGYTYCSDEIALLAENSFEVTAPHIAMCIKDSGFDTMAALFPQISDLPVYDREDGKQVRYFLPGDGRTADPAGAAMPVQRIVFPRYDPDQPPGLTRMDKATVLRIMLSECMAIPKHIDQPGIARFVRWIRDVDCFQLSVSSLDDAVTMGKQLMSEHNVSGIDQP